PQIPRVELDFMPFQEPHILIFKCLLAMMFSLMVNVMHDRFLARWTDRERSITILPPKLDSHSALLIESFGRARFQLAHKVGQTMGRSQFDQQVNVVDPPTDANRNGF